MKIIRRSVTSNPVNVETLPNGEARTRQGHLLVPEQTIVRATFSYGEEIKTRFAIYVAHEERDGHIVILLNATDGRGLRYLYAPALEDIKDLRAVNPQKIVFSLNYLLRDVS